MVFQSYSRERIFMVIIADAVIDSLASASERKVENGSQGRYVKLPRVCCGEQRADSDGLKVTAFTSGKLVAYCHKSRHLPKLENFKHCAAGIRSHYGIEIDSYEQRAPAARGNPRPGSQIPKDAALIGGVKRWDYQAADGSTITQCRQDFRRVSGELDKARWREPSGVNSIGIHVRLYGDDGQSPVVLCEGEPAADAVAAAGYVAASYFGGSSGAGKANYTALQGRAVVIWPDDDEPGRKAALAAGRCLESVASSISMVSVLDKNDGSDAADFPHDDIGIRIAEAAPWEAPDVIDLTESRYDAPVLYIERDELGLETVLEKMKLELRLNARTMATEIQRTDYETEDGAAWYGQYGIHPIPLDGWTKQNDYLRDAVKSGIARRARFFPDGRVAKFPDWQSVENAYVATRKVDPVRQWLEQLPSWDGLERVETLFVDVLGAADTELNRAAAKAFMVGAVNRTYYPGCQHDWIPVLIGEQGAGKSTFAQALVPTEHRHTWFSDQTDFSESPQKQVEGVGTALIVEFAELKGLSYAKIETAKTYLSRKTDHIRLSYRRNAEDLPRHWVGIATANPATGGVLPADETGNRRFVTIEVSPAGPAAVTAYMNAHREQLWAEARELWNRGEKSYLGDEFKVAQTAVNETYEQSNEGLANRVADFPITAQVRGAGIELLHLMERIGLVDAERRDQTALSPFHQRLVAQELMRQGWHKRIKPVWVDGSKKRKTLWYPPLPTESHCDACDRSWPESELLEQDGEKLCVDCRGEIPASVAPPQPQLPEMLPDGDFIRQCVGCKDDFAESKMHWREQRAYCVRCIAGELGE